MIKCIYVSCTDNFLTREQILKSVSTSIQQGKQDQNRIQIQNQIFYPVSEFPSFIFFPESLPSTLVFLQTDKAANLSSLFPYRLPYPISKKLYTLPLIIALRNTLDQYLSLSLSELEKIFSNWSEQKKSLDDQDEDEIQTAQENSEEEEEEEFIDELPNDANDPQESTIQDEEPDENDDLVENNSEDEDEGEEEDQDMDQDDDMVDD